MYGVRSTDKPCKKHPTSFVDNEFKNYDHEHHKKVVGELSPKYATVMDIMTVEQCEQAGIKHYDFETVMRFAEDMENYCENVIVIP